MTHQHDPAIVSAMQQEIQQLTQGVTDLPTLHLTLHHLTGVALHAAAALPTEELRAQIHEAAAQQNSTVALWPAVEVLHASVSPNSHQSGVGEALARLFNLPAEATRILH